MDSEKRLGQAAPVLGAEPRGFVAVGACTVPAPRTRVPAHASDSETRISLATPKRCRQATRIQASVAPPPFTLALRPPPAPPPFPRGFPPPPPPPCCEQRLSRVQGRPPALRNLSASATTAEGRAESRRRQPARQLGGAGAPRRRQPWARQGMVRMATSPGRLCRRQARAWPPQG